MRASRVARNRGGAGYVADDSRLRNENSFVTNLQVIYQSRLAAHQNPFPNDGASRYAALGRHDRVLTDFDVVRDVDQIVELDTTADECPSECASINGGVGTDLDVIFDDDDPNVREFDEFAFAACVAEPIGANDRAGVNDDVRAYERTFSYDRVGPYTAVVAEPNLGFDLDTRMNDGAVADLGVVSNIGEGHDGNVVTYFRRIRDVCERVNTFFRFRRGKKLTHELIGSELRVGEDDLRDVELGMVLGDQQGSGPCSSEGFGIGRPCKSGARVKAQVFRARLGQGSQSAQLDGSVSDELTPQPIG